MKLLALALPCLAALTFSSCSSVSVKDEKRLGAQPSRKPAHVYVADFKTDHGQFKIAGDDAKNPEAFKKKTSGLLADYLVKGITDHVAPAERVASTSRLPASGWLVTGEFLRVNTGSRLLRAGIGLGAGGTKMETRVQVFDLSNAQRPFMTFETTGGSNAMPGAIASSGPASAAISIVTQSAKGVTDDAARTSRMITGALNQYLVQRGWLPKEKSYSVKRLGEYQLVHEQYSNVVR